MDRREGTLTVEQRIADLIDENGGAPESVAQALGLHPAELASRLDPASITEFTFDELVRVGGLFCVPITYFFKEVAA